MKPLKFVPWLMTHTGDDNPIGDLANDAIRDSRVTKDTTRTQLKNFMGFQACDDAKIAYKEACKWYKSYKIRARKIENVYY